MALSSFRSADDRFIALASSRLCKKSGGFARSSHPTSREMTRVMAWPLPPGRAECSHCKEREK
jgi:hypothetical protein